MCLSDKPESGLLKSIRWKLLSQDDVTNQDNLVENIPSFGEDIIAVKDQMLVGRDILTHMFKPLMLRVGAVYKINIHACITTFQQV